MKTAINCLVRQLSKTKKDYCCRFLDIAALDAEYAERMTNVHFVKNPDHINADKLLLVLLRKLGCDRTADAFERLPKWYA